jgi:hypothetical protein
MTYEVHDSIVSLVDEREFWSWSALDHYGFLFFSSRVNLVH